MAFIEKRKNGRYRARYRAPDGRERSRTFNRKIDADTWLTEKTSEVNRGEWVDPQRGQITVAEWSQLWLQTKRGKKPKTIEGYRSLLRSRVLPEFGATPLTRIDHHAVERWIAELEADGLSPSRIRQGHQLLSAIFKKALRDRRIGFNPAEGVELPTEQRREMLFLNAEQVNDLADAAGAYRPLILTLAYGGMRWAETAGLTVNRVNLLRRRIEVVKTLSEIGGRLEVVAPKSGEQRTVVLPRFLATMLEPLVAGRDPDARVFTAPRGGPLRHSNFYHGTWKKAVARSGVPARLRIHDLRHTCAALLIAQGAHAKAIQQHLGHASVKLTMDRYGHLLPAAFEDLADQLDAVFQQAAAASARPGVVVRLPEPVMK